MINSIVASIRHFVEIVVGIAIRIAIVAGLFWVTSNFVLATYEVQQESMEPTIAPGARIVVDRITARFEPYRRGDIVIFRPPAGSEATAPEVPYIKRVIGVAGDTIELRDGDLYLNGMRQFEAFLPKDAVTEAIAEESSWKIAPGYLFVMGDHRAASVDSRLFGPIAVDAVIGRALIRYWPVADFGPISDVSSGFSLPGASLLPLVPPAP